MEKIFFGLMLAAGVLATSCVKDLQVNNGGDAVVSFNVGAPEIATKAFSDGMSATVLQYAVYDEAGVELTDLTVTDAVIDEEEYHTAPVNIPAIVISKLYFPPYSRDGKIRPIIAAASIIPAAKERTTLHSKVIAGTLCR